MRIALLITVFACSLHSEILDRVALVVGQTVITESQVGEEVRVTAFLNHDAATSDQSARRGAAGRLIEQDLVSREISVTHYPPPSEAEVAQLYATTEKAYGGAREMDRALDRYGLSASILKQHLARQLMILKFVDQRFRPDVEVSEEDVSEYYNKQLESWRKKHTGTPPTLDDSRASIEKALSDQRSDYALSSWIDEERRDVGIVFLDKDLARP